MTDTLSPPNRTIFPPSTITTLPSPDRTTPPPSTVNKDLPQAARMMADALWVENVTAEEAAAASGRTVEWIEGVADGTIDPTLDELELAVNAIGLEVRNHVGCRFNWNLFKTHNPQALLDRITAERKSDLELFGETVIQRSPPQPGVEARHFSAGKGRTDGGGSAAILIAFCIHELGYSKAKFSRKAKISFQKVRDILSGEWKPSANEVERMLARNGVPIRMVLEPYEYHDDELQMIWEMDPVRQNALNDSLHQEVASWNL